MEETRTRRQWRPKRVQVRGVQSSKHDHFSDGCSSILPTSYACSKSALSRDSGSLYSNDTLLGLHFFDSDFVI